MKRSIIILILIFSVLKLFSQDGVVVDKVVAVVGKNVILMSDIENQIVQAKAQGAYKSGMRCQMFKDLVFQKLLLDQAQKDSIEVTESEIEGNLDQRIRFFVNQVGSEEKLEEFYGKSVSKIKEEFREVVARQMLAERMKGTLTSAVKVTPTEVRRYFRNLSNDSIPEVPKQIVLQQIVKYPPVNEQEKLAIKEKLRGYRDRILKGEKFSTLAVLYSDDVGSARKGGELGLRGRSEFVPQFAAVAFKLENPGDISRIVETEFGFHIIQLIEKRGELMNLRHILLKPKVSVEDMYKAQTFLDSVRTLVLKDSLNFEEAVEKFSEDRATNKSDGLMINVMSGNTYFQYEHLQPALAYSLKKLKEGDLTKVIKTQDDKGKEVYKIIKIKEVVEPHKANLKQDYQLIQDMALAHKHKQFMKSWVKKKTKNTYTRIEDEYKDCDLLSD